MLREVGGEILIRLALSEQFNNTQVRRFNSSLWCGVSILQSYYTKEGESE